MHTFTRVLEGWYRANVAANSKTRKQHAPNPSQGPSQASSPSSPPPAVVTSPRAAPMSDVYEVRAAAARPCTPRPCDMLRVMTTPSVLVPVCPPPLVRQVVFREQKLGLTLRRVDGLGAVVDSKQTIEAAAPPFVGDLLLTVGGQPCDHAQVGNPHYTSPGVPTTMPACLPDPSPASCLLPHHLPV